VNRSLSRVQTIAFNKPYGVLPCFTDPERRQTLADYVAIPVVYAAGRLDLDSAGLLFLTSDGRLAHHITDPQHKLPKVYLAQAERIPNEEALEQLRKGVELNGKKTGHAEVRLRWLMISFLSSPDAQIANDKKSTGLVILRRVGAVLAKRELLPSACRDS